MAEKPKKQQQEKIQSKEQQERKKIQEDRSETLLRILGHDLPGSKNLYSGLTRIKGVSWAIANAVCIKLNMPKSKKVETLTKEDIIRIEQCLKNPPVPDYLKNRRSDHDTGETKHYLSSDLDIKREFDIKRLKEIRSYRGIRHAAKLPVRGQRTRSHFRQKGVAMGIKKKKST